MKKESAPISSQSPLALSFEESLEPSRLLSQITLSAESRVRAQVAEHGNRAMGLALAGAKVVVDAGTVQVVFQGGIPAGAKLMKAAGRRMPALVDGRTGRILKWGRVASNGRKAASLAANAALVIVEAAHMISGHDNAKRLKNVEKGIRVLVHAHESELKSRLEAIYRFSKELLDQGAEALCDEDRRELHRQCRDLIELRARWRDDFRHRIAAIDPADPGFWNKVFRWRRKEAEQRSRESKAQESIDAFEIIELMHFSLLLQMALADGAGKLEAFQRLTLPDESDSWRALAAFGRDRAKRIAGFEGAREFEHVLNSLDGLAEYWTRNQPVKPAPLREAKRVLAAPEPKHSTLHPTPSRRRRRS